MKSLLPTSIRDPHYLTIAQLIEEFVRVEELEILVPMLIDTAPVQALTHLAEFFSILGIEGWEFATTTAEKRALLKQAVELHRHKGTPWAVKEAVKKAGFSNVALEEGYGNFTRQLESIDYGKALLYDGFTVYDGKFDFGGGTDGGSRLFLDTPSISWAFFRVLIYLTSETVTAQAVQNVRLLVDMYKNERSWLTDIGFFFGVDEPTLPTSESQALLSIHRDQEEFFDWAANYNGEYAYDGSIPYGNADGITDSPDAELSAYAYYDGTYHYDNTLFYTGSTLAPIQSIVILINP